MIRDKKKTDEYKAPICKMLKVQVQNLVCASPTNEKYNEPKNLGGNWIDDEE